MLLDARLRPLARLGEEMSDPAQTSSDSMDLLTRAWVVILSTRVWEAPVPTALFFQP